ncbi:hypothetical protein GUJ93_ZPchr0010g9309 [Zizania palustris]|uniref:Uncharacterized protein n=1 Tax=Zizania palustris TaxID=103762 RepID=A0A8J5VVR5_ZIZPA|nr:hypothetical protein GUJ93_ZPchr0010g9309 [Zizania palustris]
MGHIQCTNTANYLGEQLYQIFYRETLLGLMVASFVLSRVLIGGAIITVHGAFRMLEDLFLDDTGAANGNN